MASISVAVEAETAFETSWHIRDEFRMGHGLGSGLGLDRTESANDG